MIEVRVSRSGMQRALIGLPAILLVAVGGVLTATGADSSQEIVAQSEPLITVPELPALQEGITSIPALPPLPAAPTDLTDASSVAALSPGAAVNGVPARALEAYRRAATLVSTADPQCKIDWALVAAIGKVESNHGRYGGNGIGADGTVKPGIIGIALDGSNGTAVIRDSDGGTLDRDTTWDRAVGPMQFIPGTWRTVGVDANQDGVKDPQNLDDAATATAVYLCSGPGDLTDPATLVSAIKRYNNSDDYARTVIAIAQGYRDGFSVLPAEALTPAQANGTPYLPTPGSTAAGAPGPVAAAATPGTPSASTRPSSSPKPKPGSGSGSGSGSSAASGTGSGGSSSGGNGGSGSGTGGSGSTPTPSGGGVAAVGDVVGGVVGGVTGTVGGVVSGVGGVVGGVVNPTPTPTPTPSSTPTPSPSPSTTAPAQCLSLLGIPILCPPGAAAGSTVR